MKRVLALAGMLVAVSAANASIQIMASTGTFMDISTTGTSVGSISDDSENVITGAALNAAGWAGNGLLAGGRSIRVGNNGAVLWGNSVADTFTSATQIGWANPNATNTGATSMTTMTADDGSIEGNGGIGGRQMIAPLWDDNFPGSGASTRWRVMAGNLIIQWTNQDHFNAQGTGTITYQMKVFGGVPIAGGQTLVEFVYNDTSYSANQYQNDGGSACIGYKNWGINALANDVEYGICGGAGQTTTDPAFNGTNMQPKVSGIVSGGNPALTHAVKIIPEPASIALLALGGLALLRRRA
ncbi:MAG: PEP-CTERM sorting domain-containing protein [Phycisphaerae bacterium]